MAKPSLSSLASGVMTRLGQLTVQSAQKARVSAGKAAHKSLIEVNKLLDEAIEATKPDGLSAPKASAPKDVKKSSKSTKASPMMAPAKKSGKRK